LTFAVALNVILAAGVVGVLACVSRIPYRLDRVARASERRAIEELGPLVYEHAA